MGFVQLRKSNQDQSGDIARRMGAWWAVDPQFGRSRPRLHIYLYEDAAGAIGLRPGHRVFMHVGTHNDAGLIYLVPTDDETGMAVTKDHKKTRRLRIDRTMNCWALPELPKRKAQKMEWAITEFNGQKALRLMMNGKDAEELRRAQEHAALKIAHRQTE